MEKVEDSDRPFSARRVAIWALGIITLSATIGSIALAAMGVTIPAPIPSIATAGVGALAMAAGGTKP